MRAAELAGLLCAGLALACPAGARAHHGSVAVGFAGPEGPGSAIETTSALLLPEGTLLLFLRTEVAPFRQFAWADPENKESYWFTTPSVGYGITPWLGATLLLPWAVKTQQSLGTSAGIGDPTVLLALGFKADEGLRLLPERESLDELVDWHFSVWLSTTIPLGETERVDDQGSPFRPDMQPGFGSPSPGLGLAVLKQLSADVTWLADASVQWFFPHDYSFTRYQFGGETRANTSIAWRAYAAGGLRLDVVAEAGFLHLRRDREGPAGEMEPLTASGGAILYLGGGLRLYRGRLLASFAVRGPSWKDLNEESSQQGAEGLERFRASASVGYAFGL